MADLYLFAENPGTGETKQLAVDPAHVDRQVRDLRALGWTATVLDEDERISYGQIAQQITKNSCQQEQVNEP